MIITGNGMRSVSVRTDDRALGGTETTGWINKKKPPEPEEQKLNITTDKGASFPLYSISHTSRYKSLCCPLPSALLRDISLGFPTLFVSLKFSQTNFYGFYRIASDP